MATRELKAARYLVNTPALTDQQRAALAAVLLCLSAEPLHGPLATAYEVALYHLAPEREDRRRGLRAL